MTEVEWDGAVAAGTEETQHQDCPGMTLPGHTGQSHGDRQVSPEDSGGIHRMSDRVNAFRVACPPPGKKTDVRF